MRYGPENPVLETPNFVAHQSCSDVRDCTGCGICLEAYELADRVMEPLQEARYGNEAVAMKVGHIQRGLRKTNCQHPQALQQIAAANSFIEQNSH